MNLRKTPSPAPTPPSSPRSFTINIEGPGSPARSRSSSRSSVSSVASDSGVPRITIEGPADYGRRRSGSQSSLESLSSNPRDGGGVKEGISRPPAVGGVLERPLDPGPAPVTVPPQRNLAEDMTAARTWFDRNMKGKTIPDFPQLGSFMDPIVGAYGSRKPDAHVFHAKDAASMFATLKTEKDRLKDGPIYSILSVPGGHQSAWCFHAHEGRITAIGIDTVTAGIPLFGTSPKILAQLQANPGLVDSSALFGTGVQKDRVTCGAFAMSFLTTFRKHPEHFKQLSQDLLDVQDGKGVAHIRKKESVFEGSRFRLIQEKDALKLLPVHTFRHTQSPELLAGLAKRGSDPSEEGDPKTLQKIQARNERISSMPATTEAEIEARKFAINEPIHGKRIVLLDRAIDHVRATEAPEGSGSNLNE